MTTDGRDMAGSARDGNVDGGTGERPVSPELPPLPWTPQEALTASRLSREEQERVAGEVKQAFADYARAEKLYRVALARKIWDLKRSGVAVTACENLAKGDEEIAVLKETRDSAEGLKETAKIAGWLANADRRDVGELITWSMRRDLAEGYGQAPQQNGPIYGQRRAA